tara:strand:- start:310 stop:579 length:270 start_codon:yes stop_codon:yes gene_type:complete
MLYAQGTVTGAGFLTHADREDRGVYIELWGNIIVLNNGAEWWLTRNSLTAISKAAAQALYDTHMDTAIAGFDPDDNNEGREEPTRRTLP